MKYKLNRDLNKGERSFTTDEGTYVFSDSQWRLGPVCEQLTAFVVCGVLLSREELASPIEESVAHVAPVAPVEVKEAVEPVVEPIVEAPLNEAPIDLVTEGVEEAGESSEDVIEGDIVEGSVEQVEQVEQVEAPKRGRRARR